MKKRHINLFWGSPAPTLPNVDFRILRFIFNKPLNLYHHRCRPKSPGARENPARPRRQEALGERVKVSPSPSQTHGASSSLCRGSRWRTVTVAASQTDMGPPHIPTRTGNGASCIHAPPIVIVLRAVP